MQPDLEEYWPDLDGYDLSDDEKRQLIHTLWNMMESVVDSALGTHPVQQAVKAKAAKDSKLPCGEVESRNQAKTKSRPSRQFRRKASPKRKS